MDTLSRDSSSSSSNIVPMIGVFTGVIGLLLAIVALVQLSTVKKNAAAQADELNAKIANIESEVRSASTRMDTDIKSLRQGVQSALDQVGEQLGVMRAQLTKMEEEAKKRAAAPVAGAKGGKAAPTGVKNADGTYTVAAGDNLSKIARKFGVSLDAIQAENPGVTPTSLKIGQKIRLPR